MVSAYGNLYRACYSLEDPRHSVWHFLAGDPCEEEILEELPEQFLILFKLYYAGDGILSVQLFDVFPF